MTTGSSLPEPSASAEDPASTFLEYLDYFRAEVRRKVTGLDQDALIRSRLPSGWSPSELVSHLAHMERRWLVWGFLGERVESPWGDQDETGRWTTDQRLVELLAALDEGGRRTRSIVSSHGLLDHSIPGGRFAEAAPTPTLLAILFHVTQEYARHTGHLDVARELIDGVTGEG